MNLYHNSKLQMTILREFGDFILCVHKTDGNDWDLTWYLKDSLLRHNCVIVVDRFDQQQDAFVAWNYDTYEVFCKPNIHYNIASTCKSIKYQHGYLLIKYFYVKHEYSLIANSLSNGTIVDCFIFDEGNIDEDIM